MIRKRTSALGFLVVALLFSSLFTAHLPTAFARHVVVLKANDDQNTRGHVGVCIHGKKGWEERKLIDARDMGANEAVGVKKETWDKTVAGKTANPVAIAGSRPRTVEMPAPTKNHQDAVAEMHNMLRRDYAFRPRRRSPVHNGEPLEDDAP